ncbi:hypothetical protein M6G53_24395 [Serratia nevei]|uniref:hypothetical protein n=1 Tax=Serratia nevei TaxID=2703794 RepID=UPI00209D16D0|nr:hypothetical protein [Serratia nevei]MCP1108508.1 hypothetical protein [Serratia nevei]
MPENHEMAAQIFTAQHDRPQLRAFFLRRRLIFIGSLLAARVFNPFAITPVYAPRSVRVN